MRERMRVSGPFTAGMNWEIGDRKGDKKKKYYQKKDNKKINLGVDNLMNDIMGD